LGGAFVLLIYFFENNMLPLRKEFTINLKIWEDKYVLKYLEATAEETFYFQEKTKNTKDFLAWLPMFLDWLDSLTFNDKKKIMKSIERDPESVVIWLYNQITSTRFRKYKSRYEWVKKRPKPKGSETIQGCDASTELNLSKETMIPIHLLNKELTLYQKQWIIDWIICNNLNSFKEWQKFNRELGKKEEIINNPEKYKEQKKALDRLSERLAVLDSKKK